MVLRFCPYATITFDALRCLRLYNQCKQFNTLPESGGVLEQDNKTMEILSFIDIIMNTLNQAKPPKQGGENK